jgi:hypothetical protein
MPRYFVAVKGFLDKTAFIRFDGKQAFIVSTDGTELNARLRLDQIERSVRLGVWKEVAQTDTIALIDATKPGQPRAPQSLTTENNRIPYNPQYSKDLQTNRVVVASIMDATSDEDKSLTAEKILNV